VDTKREKGSLYVGIVSVEKLMQSLIAIGFSVVVEMSVNSMGQVHTKKNKIFYFFNIAWTILTLKEK